LKKHLKSSDANNSFRETGNKPVFGFYLAAVSPLLFPILLIARASSQAFEQYHSMEE
jgi:hypothetical protein